MKIEKHVLNEKRNTYLTAYIQETGGEFGFEKRPAMIVMAGGAYMTVSDREADAAAMAYLKAGYQVFVLHYTVASTGNWPDPLEDYEQAASLVKENADKWHLDLSRIAVTGFSAGGHLAGCAATIAKNKPAAAVLVYPAVTEDVLQSCPMDDLPALDRLVDRDTCPCFIVAARDDMTVPVENVLKLEQALSQKGIPFESHIYSYGGHGFSTGEEWVIQSWVSERLPNWVADSIGWLKENMGGLKRNGFGSPHVAVAKNSDDKEYLSVACSLRHIREQSPQVQNVVEPLYKKMRELAAGYNFPFEQLCLSMEDKMLLQIMGMLGLSDEIEPMNRKLQAIRSLSRRI